MPVSVEFSDVAWGVWFSAASSTLLPAHHHGCAELNLIMSGRLTYRVDGRQERLQARAGELVAIPASATHELVGCSADLTLWVIELRGAQPLTWTTEARSLAPAEAWRKAVLPLIRKLWLRPPSGEVRALQDQLWTALSTIDVLDAPSAPDAHPAVEQARSVCENLANRQLDISRLARASGLSASRLAHLFADQLGLTPLQYRNFARVQYFIQAYDGDEHNLLRAALRAGFGSYAQFHRTFRQVCGEAPTVHFKWLASAAQQGARRTLGSTAPLTSVAL